MSRVYVQGILVLTRRCCLLRSIQASGPPAASTIGGPSVFGSSAAETEAPVPAAQTLRPMLDLNEEPPEESSP